tara:strand:+ start:1980 stop:2135 length:156 start_codon:yes stop_codon:yes gene_type:complete
MPANPEGLEKLNQKEIEESARNDYGNYSFMGLSDQCESEVQWIKLHQMFDR